MKNIKIVALTCLGIALLVIFFGFEILSTSNHPSIIKQNDIVVSCPELELVRDTYFEEKEKTFTISITLEKTSAIIGFKASFTELPNKNSLPIDGFIEFDGKRIKTWKNTTSFYGRSSGYAVQINKSGTYTVKLSISQPAYLRFSIETSSYDKGNCEVIDLREIENNNQEIDNIKERINKLTVEQKKELLKWLQQNVGN